MNWSNVNDSSPSCFLHVRKRVLWKVECCAKIKCNNLFPFGLREIDALVNMLHTSIVDQNINSSEFFKSFINDLLAVCCFTQISKNIERFSVRILSLELTNSLFNLLIRCKSIEDNIVSSCSKRVSNSKTNTTQRASDQRNFVIFP